MSIPAISILLPTYQGEAFLAEQIGSILAQSLTDFELLIVDDGSVDESAGIAAAFAARDSRIAILPAEGNAGQKERLRQLLRRSRAPLIAIADQDDIWDRNKLSILAERIGEAALALGRSDLIDGDGRPLGRSLIEGFGPTPDPADRLSLLVRPTVSGHAALIRRDQIADAAFARFQAFDWLISLDAAFGRGIVYADEAIVRHRIHGGNQSNAEAIHLPGGRERIRNMLHFRRRERLYLVQRLEHLAHSEIVAEDVRRIFSRAAAIAQSSWFAGGKEAMRGSQAMRALCDLLGPLAGSGDDRAIFEAHLRLLTRSRLSPRAFAGGARRLLAR